MHSEVNFSVVYFYHHKKVNIHTFIVIYSQKSITRIHNQSAYTFANPVQVLLNKAWYIAVVIKRM